MDPGARFERAFPAEIENVSQDEANRRAKAWYQAATETPVEAEYPVAAYPAEETLANDNIAV